MRKTEESQPATQSKVQKFYISRCASHRSVPHATVCSGRGIWKGQSGATRQTVAPHEVSGSHSLCKMCVGVLPRPQKSQLSMLAGATIACVLVSRFLSVVIGAFHALSARRCFSQWFLWIRVSNHRCHHHLRLIFTRTQARAHAHTLANTHMDNLYRTSLYAAEVHEVVNSTFLKEGASGARVSLLASRQ